MPKYHNYRLEGPYYIDKGGHDSNPGTDPNAPRKTAVTTGVSLSLANIFGAGVYAIGYVLPAVKGDGRVVLKPATEGTYFSCSGNHNYHNLEMWYPDFNVNISTTAGTDCFDCIIRYGKGVTGSSSSARSRRFNRCVILDSNLGNTLTTASAIQVNESIVLRSNTYFNDSSQAHDSYFGPNCNLIFLFSRGPISNYFNNNNIQGKFVINGETYEVKRKRDGTPADNIDASIKDIASYVSADGVANFSDFYSRGNFNEDPKFSDPSAEDFTLQADSPHIRAARDGFSNIGGTKVGSGVRNTDDGNASGVRVLPSPGMDTSNPDAFILKVGETEAYVDYVFPLPGIALTSLDVSDLFDFDTDFAGGSVRNSNVVDAEPQTSDYALFVPTSGAAPNTSSLVVPAGAIQVGQHVWVNGQGREVTGKTTNAGNDTLTLSSALLATIGAGVNVTFGTEQQLAALHPNRLTNWLRTKSTPEPPTIPLVDSEWDNEVHPSYNAAGRFLNQEVGGIPGLIVYNGQVWGAGDAAAPVGVPVTEIAGLWANARVFKRNNQTSKGLPWQG